MATRFPLDTTLSHLYDAAANDSLWPEVSPHCRVSLTPTSHSCR